MAYRLTAGAGHRVRFDISPLLGYTFGAGTFAAFLKRSSLGLGIANFLIDITDSSNAHKVMFYFGNNNTIRILCSANVEDGVVIDTTNWLLVAVTFPSSGTARFHIHNGTSWTHTNVSAVGSSGAIVSSDKLMFGSNDDGTAGFVGDAVCSGIKMSDSSDAAIETLSRTSFQAWRDFGFDWLVGFENLGLGWLADLGAAGTGDQIARTGCTLVADPPGWVWSGATFIPPSTFGGLDPALTYMADIETGFGGTFDDLDPLLARSRFIVPEGMTDEVAAELGCEGGGTGESGGVQILTRGL